MKKEAPKKETKKNKEEIIRLDPKIVGVGWRARSDFGQLEELVSSIREIGLLHPIVVSQDGNKYSLVSGARRLEACKKLGIPILARVISLRDEWQELQAQIHENLRRKDFDALENALCLQRSKEIYERLHPETKHGQVKNLRRGASSPEVADTAIPGKSAPRFTLVAARQSGFSERKVQEYLELANLPGRIRKKIEACETSEERDRMAHECLKQARHERKIKKLEEEAEQKKSEKVSESSEKPGALIHADNKSYFVGKEIYDLILTDPPSPDKSLMKTIAKAGVSSMLGWVMHASPMLTSKGQMLVFCALEDVGAYAMAFEAAELIYRGAIVWHQDDSHGAKAGYSSACRAIVWATKGDKYCFQYPEGKAGAVVQGIYTGPGVRGSESLQHPEQKPEWLIAKLLQRHTVDKSKVFDPFAGVATVSAVCRKMGLECTAIEKDEAFYRAGKARLAAI